MRRDICCKMVEMISDDDHVIRVSSSTKKDVWKLMV